MNIPDTLPFSREENRFYDNEGYPINRSEGEYLLQAYNLLPEMVEVLSLIVNKTDISIEKGLMGLWNTEEEIEKARELLNKIKT